VVTVVNRNASCTTEDILIYIDGVRETTSVGIGNINTNTNNSMRNIHLGRLLDGATPSGYFNGSMDEVAIFNRSLSAVEILNAYKRGVNRLNLSVRGCDDPVCNGESFTDVGNNTALQNLSVNNTQYFQYRFKYETDDGEYTPELHNVSIGYETAVVSADLEVTAQAE